jgi:medium-chain acyl-[acyl-carrier-protein] hydrolase
MGLNVMSTKAFFIPQPRPGVPMRLICFPYAGGAPWTYREWSDELPEVEVCTACLPGRGARFREPPASRLAMVADAFADHLATAFDDKPLALFGHSFGALLAFAVAQALQRGGGPSPQRVFVSACAPTPSTRVGDDEDLLALLAANPGVPEAVREDPTLQAMALGTLRADLVLASAYRPSTERLRAPVTTCCGDADPQATPAAMQAWQAHAIHPLDELVVPGGHFFLHDRGSPLFAALRRALQLNPRETP